MTSKLEPWKDVDTLQMMVDSDWATDRVDRRSTSAGVAQLGGCLTAEHRDRRQCHQLKRVELKLALHSDSTATISQHTKMGLGRMKHV